MALKRDSYYYNSTLRDYVTRFQRLPEVSEGGEIGVEIEVEGENLPQRITGWAVHADGSLRGESAEFVFNGPASREETRKRLETFRQRLQNAGSNVHESYRTSVHVHLNAQNMLIRHIYTQMLLYILFEDVFAKIAGSERIGNLFCLRAKDAEFFLEQAINAIRNDDITHLNTDQIRYSAVNPASLFKHGTLEFRSFRGTTDIELIDQWVKLLLALKDAANGNVFDNPIQIVQEFSSRGPDGLANLIFTPDQINMFPDGWRDTLFEGARLIQRLAYAHDWKPTPDKVVKESKPKTEYVNMQAGWNGVAVPQPRAVDLRDIEAILNEVEMPHIQEDEM